MGYFCRLDTVATARRKRFRRHLMELLERRDLFAVEVIGLVINDGQAQRSQLTSIEVQFNELVDHGRLAQAFRLQNIDRAIDVATFTVAPIDTGNATSVKLSFDPGPSVVTRLGAGRQSSSLADGDYRLEVLANQVRAAATDEAMAADFVVGGIPNNPAEDRKLFRLFGDTNGDGLRNGIDLQVIVPTLFSPINYRADLDSNGDGLINGVDLQSLIPTFFGPARGQINKAPIATNQNASVDEDTTLIVNAAATDPDDANLTLRLISPPRHGSVATAGTQVTYVPDRDYFGTDQLVYVASDGRLESAVATLTIQVAPINDAPRPRTDNVAIRLDDAKPVDSIALNTLFNDVDSDVLTYEITQSTLTHGSATIVDGRLVVAADEGYEQTAFVTVKASDSSGAFAVYSVQVLADRLELPDVIQYALTHDQVIPFGGQAVVVVETNLNTLSGLTVESVDQTTIAVADVEVEPIGDGKLRVKVRHRTNDYGVTFLKLVSNGQAVTEFAVMVTPPENHDKTSIGVPTVRYDSHSDGETIIRYVKTVNTRWLASQVVSQTIRQEQAFDLVRIADPVQSAVYNRLSSVNGSLELRTVQSSSQKNLEAGLTQLCYSTPSGQKCILDLPPTGDQDPLDFVRRKLKAVDWDGAGEEVWKYYQNPLNWITWDFVEGGLELGRAYVNNTDFTELLDNPDLDNESIRAIVGVAIDMIELADFRDIIDLVARPDRLEKLLKRVEELAKRSDVMSRIRAAFEATHHFLQRPVAILEKLQQIGDFVGDNLFSGLSEFAKRNQKLSTHLADAYRDLAVKVPLFADTFEVVGAGIESAGLSVEKTLTESLNGSVSQFVAGDELLGETENAKKLSGSEIIGVGADLYGIAKSGMSIANTLGDILGGSDEIDPNADKIISRSNDHTDQSHQTGNGNDIVTTAGGDDSVITGGGSDTINVGEGLNHVIAGNGNDAIWDGAGGSLLSGGAGDDTFYDFGGGDTLEGGTGYDKFIYPTSQIGNDRILDPSRAGEIRLDGYAFAELGFRKDRYDLEIYAPPTLGQIDHSIRVADYFKYDRSQWLIRDKFGTTVKLDDLTGRLDPRTSLRLAMHDASVPLNASQLPLGFSVSNTFVVTATSGNVYHLQILEDVRGNAAGRSGAAVIIGGQRELAGMFSRLPIGGLADAVDVLAKIRQEIDISTKDFVSVFGASDGGVVAQWVAAALSTRVGSGGPDAMANVVALNAPDVSGVISETLSSAFPEYRNGMPKLTTTMMMHADDWASRLSTYSGNELSYASWIQWREPTPPGAITGSQSLAAIERAHRFDSADFIVESLTFEPMSADEILSHVQLNDFDDFAKATAISQVEINGEMFLSTVGWTNVLIDLSGDGATSAEEQLNAVIAAWTEDANRMAAHFVAARHAAPTTLWRFDFGPDSNDAHVEPLFQEVNPDHRYSAQTNFGFLPSDELEAHDTGRASDTERDFVSFTDATFVVEVAPGTYDIALTMGDRENVRENVRVDINGYSTDVVSTLPGSYLTRNYRVDTLDGTIRLRLRDLGGASPRGVLNSLVITAAGYRDELAASETNQEDSAIFVLTHGYDMTPLDLEQISDAFVELVVDVALAVATGPATGFTSTALILGGSLANFASNFTTNPLAKGLLGATGSILTLAAGAPKFNNIKSTVDGIKRVREGVEFLDKGLKTVAGAIETGPLSLRETSRVHEWVFDAAISFSQQAQQFSVGQLDPNVTPVDFEDVDAIIQNAIDNPPADLDRTYKELLAQWQGSRDFLALDWADISNDGIGLFGSDEAVYRNSVNRAARAAKWLIEAQISSLQKADPAAKVDLLLVSHGTGYNVNRELVDRLDKGSVAEDLDYVKFVTLDPISTNRDELEDTQFQSDKYQWYHPELTPILSAVDNYYQTSGLYESNSFAFNGIPTFGFLSELVENRIDEELVFGLPLDDREGGSRAGFYNRSARVFRFEDGPDVLAGIGEVAGVAEDLRFRHWDPNTARLEAGELTDIEFSGDGRLLATASQDGSVTVRTVEAIPAVLDSAGNVTVPAKSAGTVLINVYQNGLDYRDRVAVTSVAFSSDSKRLLTASDEAGTILVTDATTGRPLWRGDDANVWRASFSPSGDTIVSVDRQGNGLVWQRQAGTEAYSRLTVQAVPLHDEGIGALVVVRDDLFITGSADKRMRVWQVGANGRLTVVDVEAFNGTVRGLDFDPITRLVAVGAGQKTYLYRLSESGRLEQQYMSPDHVGAVQGVAFNAPVRVVNTENPASAYAGLVLITGGEDKTIFRLDLGRFAERAVVRTAVISGAMLPVREISTNPKGDLVAVVSQDNVDDDTGGPVRDIDVTQAANERAGLHWDRWFVDGQRQHNSVPFEYIENTIDQGRESFLWDRNNSAASRPGAIAADRNLTLPAFKRAGEGVDPIDLYLRPGQSINFFPKKYLIDVDKDDFQLTGFEVPNALDGTLVRPSGQNDTLRYTAPFSLSNGLTKVIELDVVMTGLPKTNGESADVRMTTLRIHVVNEAPVTGEDIERTYPGRRIEIPLRANDFDFEGDTLSDIQFDMAQSGLHGTVQFEAGRPNILVYTASSQANVSNGDLVDRFTYTVRDSFGATSVGIVSVTVGDYEGPQHVTASAIGADQLRLTWDPVGWDVNRYLVLRDNGATDPKDWTEVANVDAQTHQAFVRNLTAQTNYKFVIMARNTSLALNPVSEIVPVRTPDYEPVDVAGIDVTPRTVQVDIRWEPVYWNAHSYRVELGFLSAAGVFTLAPGVDTKTRSADKPPLVTFKELQPDTTYAVRVISIGPPPSSGPAREVTSAPKLLRTLERGPVESVILGRVGPNKVEVSWIAPGWSVERYRVIVADRTGKEILENGVPKFRIGNLSPATRSVILNGLDVDPNMREEYVIYVEAQDAAGNWISPHPDSAAVPTATITGSVIVDATFWGRNHLVEYEPAAAESPAIITLPPLQSVLFGSTLRLFNTSSGRVNIAAATGEELRFEGQLTTAASLSLFADTVLEDGDVPVDAGSTEQDDPEKPTVTYLVFRDLDHWRVIRTGSAVAVRMNTVNAADLRETREPQVTAYPFGMELEWRQPFWNVVHYELTLTATSGSGEPTRFKEIVDNGSYGYSHRFQNLTEGVTYRFDLVAKGTINGQNVTSLVWSSSGDDYTTGRLAATLRPVQVGDASLRPTSATLRWDYFLVDANGGNVLDETGEPVRVSPDELNLNALHVEYATNTNPEWRIYEAVDSLVVTSLETTVRDLRPDRTYRFRIVSGYPQADLDSNAITLPPRPPASGVPAQSIVAISGSIARRGFTVRWLPANFDVKNYAIWVEKLNAAGNPTGNRIGLAEVPGVNADSELFSYTFTGLDPETDYVVGIAPKNAAANINADSISDLIEYSGVITTLGRVAAVNVVAEISPTRATINNANLVRVSWEHDTIAADLTTNPPLRFVVEKRQCENGVCGSGTATWDIAWIQPANLLPGLNGRTTYSVVVGPDPQYNSDDNRFTELRPGRTYEFRVRTEYSAETLLSSAATTVTMPAPPPVKVNGVDWVYPTSAQLSWAQVFGVELTRYEIIATDVNSGAVVIGSYPVGTGPQTRVITGLSEGTTYNFVVRPVGTYEGQAITAASDSAPLRHTTPAYVTPLFGNGAGVQPFTEVRPTKVNVNWTYPGGQSQALEIVDKFQIIRRVNGGTQILATIRPADRPGILIDGVTVFDEADVVRNANAAWVVFIRAVFKDGEIRDSQDATMPLPITAPAELEQPLPTDIGATDITLRWTHPGSTTQLVGFRIFKQNIAGEFVIAKDDLPASTRSFQLTNIHTKLVPGRSYAFRVDAIYNNIPNPPSNVVNVTLAAAAAPANVRETGPQRRLGVTVAWNAPSPTWEVKDYLIKLTKPNGSVVPQTVNAAILEATFNDLEANTNYHIEVVARNLDIDSDLKVSAFGNVQTEPYIVPSKPTTSEVGFTSMKVSWIHADPAGAPIRFELFRNGNFVRNIAVGATNAHSYIDTGLSAGQSYTYRVRAVYAEQIVNSPDSDPQPTLATTVPSGFSITQNGSGNNNFTFNWTHAVPAGAAGLVTYRIERRAGTGSFGEWKAINATSIASTSTSTTQSWTGTRAQFVQADAPLNPNTTYRFKVIAIYQGNLEVESEVVLIPIR